jgi:hypothetical protein
LRSSAALALAALLVGSAAAGAEEPGPAPEAVPAEDVADFVKEAAPVCASRPAADCVAAGWGFADRDGDGALAVEEANALRDGVQNWFLGARDELPKAATTGVAVGLLALQLVGVDTLHGNYDEDGDGLVSRSEALADVSLDDRPLPLLLQDRSAVDWDSLLGRLGAGGLVLGDLIPEAGTGVVD